MDYFYRYIGLIFYKIVIKLENTNDGRQKNSILSTVFPVQVMSRDRYQTISWKVHMSDSD